MFRGTSYDEPWPIVGHQKEDDRVANHRMRLSHPFVDPAHSKLQSKPVVDCFSPPSTIREDHWYRTHGHGGALFWGHNSLNHFIMTPEAVPYTDSYSTWDVCKYIWGVMNMVYGNWYMGRMNGGSVNVVNPRMRWAHSVVFWTGLLRVNLAWLVGVCGYFYAYEFLYTYVPFFRIDDPTPEGWKDVYKENQTTYAARFVASIFPGAGYVIWKGAMKKSAFWFSFAAWNALYYEVGRINTFQGTLYMLGFENSLDNDKFKRLGQLVPEVERRIDPDTAKPYWISSYKNLRLSHSELVDRVWDNKNHDYCPGSNQSCIVPNPWFNFQKMSQTFHERPILYKSELWKLPNVLSAYMLSGANDRDVVSA